MRIEQSSSGFVAGLSIALPIWDRRAGAVETAAAESRRRTAEGEVVRRQAVREATEAFVAHHALAEQLALLRSTLGEQATAALRAAEVLVRRRGDVTRGVAQCGARVPGRRADLYEPLWQTT